MMRKYLLLFKKEEGNEDFSHFVLSEGFSPIGIKEYGGMLYIVSGKKGDMRMVNKRSYHDRSLELS